MTHHTPGTHSAGALANQQGHPLASGGVDWRITQMNRLLEARLTSAPPRKRVHLADLRAYLDRIDPGGRTHPDRRLHLLEVLTGCRDGGTVTFPAQGSWDRSERPHLPRFVNLTGYTPPAAADTTRTRVIWHHHLSWAATVALPAKSRATLEVINEWLFNNPAPVQAPMRERSLEIFGDEKNLDSLTRTALFRPGRLSLPILATHRTLIRFVTERVGPGSTLLIVENSDTFESFHTYAQAHPHPRLGAIGWGSGRAFQSSVLSISSLPTIDRVLYFGDLDPAGLAIPAEAERAYAQWATEEGLPPVQVRPATDLYEALIATGTPGSEKPVPHETATDLAQWLPPHLRRDATDFLVAGRRLAQESIGMRWLTEDALRWDRVL